MIILSRSLYICHERHDKSILHGYISREIREEGGLEPAFFSFSYCSSNTASTTFSDDLPSSQLQNLSRSEEHTSELQSRGHLVCRLLLEKKKKNDNII